MSTVTKKNRLLCGANVRDVDDIVGKPVREVRALYSDILNIAPEAQVRRGDDPVGEDHIVQEGEQLEFVMPEGDKG